MFGHKRNFIYGYISGILEEKIIQWELQEEESKTLAVYIPAKYYLPKKYLKYKAPTVIAGEKVRKKAYIRFRKHYSNDIKDILNMFLDNNINKAYRVISADLLYSNKCRVPVYQIEVKKFKIEEI